MLRTHRLAIPDLLRKSYQKTATKSLAPEVVCATAGPRDLDEISDVLHAAQDRAKVKRFGLHCVRHFFASALHEAGASLAQARDHLGHATIDMTDRCTHVPDSGRKHVESIGRDFSSVGNLLSDETEDRAGHDQRDTNQATRFLT